MSHLYTYAFVALALVSSCKRPQKFPSLDEKFATPTAVAADSTGDYFYVINSDDNRDFNVGSIVTISKDGDKVAVTPTARLGRNLAVAGKDLFAIYSGAEDGSASRLDLFDVTNPKALALSASWGLDDCNPINVVARENYKYFAVSCANGAIIVGELGTPRSATQIHRVRQYPGARRAIHIDTARNLLIGFPTDLRQKGQNDATLTDVLTYADTTEGAQTTASNEIPDKWEETRSDRRNKSRRGTYQFFVYDLAAEAAKQFPRVDDSTTVPSELRWIYFNLFNFDGSPDIPETTATLTSHYYRTNFWEARPDLTDPDVFYLSHRGTSETNSPGSPHANSIIRVRIKGDLKATGDVAPRTDDTLTFERVYGFKGELEPNGKSFPCSFELATVQGAPLLVVNHFRDIKNFPVSHYSSIATKVLGEDGWFSEITESTTGHSYSHIAVTPSGRSLAISFYQSVAILLDAAPGAAITEVKTIN